MHHVLLLVVDVVKEEVVVLQLPDRHHKGLDNGEAPIVEVGLVLQQSIESKREGDDKEENDSGDFEEGSEDVGEHDDVDAKEGHLPDQREKVEPDHGDAHRTLR